MSPTEMPPTEEDLGDLLLACRYGDVDDIRLFVDTFGPPALTAARDGNGNSVLHMVAGNGHTDALDLLLPLVPPSLLSAPNSAGSTPLHWAALNAHISVAQKLVLFPAGPGVDLIDIKNSSGRSPLGEAENSGWEEGAKWFVQVMNLNLGDADKPNTGEEQVAEEEDLEAVDGADNIEVEIQDAEGQVAKMTLAHGQLASASSRNAADVES